MFFAIDYGKRLQQINLSKDQGDQYQSRSSVSARDNHPDQVLEPDQRHSHNTINDYTDNPANLADKVSLPIASTTKYFGKNPYHIPFLNIKWNWVKFLQIANFYNLKK